VYVVTEHPLYILLLLNTLYLCIVPRMELASICRWIAIQTGSESVHRAQLECKTRLHASSLSTHHSLMSTLDNSTTLFLWVPLMGRGTDFYSDNCYSDKCYACSCENNL